MVATPGVSASREYSRTAANHPCAVGYGGDNQGSGNTGGRLVRSGDVLAIDSGTIL